MKTLNIYIFVGFIVFFFIRIGSGFAQPQLPFTIYSGNSILTPTLGSWDESGSFIPTVIKHDTTYYLFYNGCEQPHIQGNPLFIGYATSFDGYNFYKSQMNPILTGDSTGFDAWQVSKAVPIIQDSMWIMYYCGKAQQGIGPGRMVGRATAPHPDSTWTRLENPVLSPGPSGEWDYGFVAPQCVIKTDTNLIMYYMGGDGIPFYTSTHFWIGMATSIDTGLTWEKYNDTTTTSLPFAYSDPVLHPGPAGSWDYISVADCDVLKNDSGFEMFYTGGSGPNTYAIGYAYSEDGIHWNKDTLNNPIFTVSDDPMATGFIEGPTVIIIDSLYFMFYFDSTWSFVNLATASISPSAIELENNINPHEFLLLQNYPNPFNPETTIEFALPHTGFVSLKIYNILGEEVATLVSEKLPAARYKYEWDAGSLASGIYFYRIKAGDFVRVKKMILMK